MNEDGEFVDEEPKYTFPNMGRPPVFKDAEDMQNAIRDYFQRGVTKRREVIGKGTEKRIVQIPVPTITGLVLWLGFADRSSFYDYEQKPEFFYTIKRARTFIENVYEEILQTKGNAAAIFALKNFGWVDKTEQVISGNYEDTREKLRQFYDDRGGLQDDNNAADTTRNPDA